MTALAACPLLRGTELAPCGWAFGEAARAFHSLDAEFSNTMNSRAKPARRTESESGRSRGEAAHRWLSARDLRDPWGGEPESALDIERGTPPHKFLRPDRTPASVGA